MGQNAIRIVVIHNPVSGRRSRARLDRVLTRMREAGAQVTLRETAGPGDAEILAREAGNFDVVAVAGGDGTVNEALNGLGTLEGEAPRGKTPRGEAPALAFIPLGTANILAHELGLPRGAAGLADVILNGERRVTWLGRANGRRFLLMVSAGFDARVVAGVNTVSKRFLGAGAYVVAAFKEMWRGGGRHSVEVDGEVHEAATVIVTKARHYGGGFVLVRGARLEEPKLHVVCLAGSGAWNMLRYGLALLRGRLDRLDDVRILEGVAVRVEGDSGETAAPVQMDGDLQGNLPLEVSIDETPVSLLVPARK